jgi:hypothetical protein
MGFFLKEEIHISNVLRNKKIQHEKQSNQTALGLPAMIGITAV